MMKSIASLILMLGVLFALPVNAQKVASFQYLTNYEGGFKEWREKKDGKIYPQKGYSFYLIENDFWVILPADPVSAQIVKKSIKKIPTFDRTIFEEEYSSYKKKKPKNPKDPKNPKLKGIKAVCFATPNCSGNCGAVLVNGVFARCTGTCCGPDLSQDPWGRLPLERGTPREEYFYNKKLEVDFDSTSNLLVTLNNCQ